MNQISSEDRKPAKYMVIHDWLASRIVAGKIKAGSQLPSENTLARQFGFSRVTVRSALNALKRSGMIESRQGSGYFARGIKAELDLRRFQGLDEVLTGSHMRASAKVVARSSQPAKPSYREKLGLNGAETVTVVRRLRFINGSVVSHEERVFPDPLARQLSDEELNTSDVCALLEQKLDLPPIFGDVLMEGVPAPEDVARGLEIEPGDFVLRLEQVSYASGHPPLEYLVRHALPGAFRYRTRIGRW